MEKKQKKEEQKNRICDLEFKIKIKLISPIRFYLIGKKGEKDALL